MLGCLCDRLQVHHIRAKETLHLLVDVQMEYRAELLDKCVWQADVFLVCGYCSVNFMMKLIHDLR